MAKKPAPAPEDDGRAKRQKEAQDRLAAARRWKADRELDFRECYFFAAPSRQRMMNSTSAPAISSRMRDESELLTDEAFLLCGDFVTEVVNGFMPEAKQWCERGPGMDLKPEVWDQVKKDVGDGDKAIFAAMRASNLYPEVAKAFYPDLAIGTVSMWIDRPHPARPIVNAAIPLRELEINLGPHGDVDDRFAVRYTRNTYVRELLGEEIWAKVPEKLRKLIEDKPDQRTEVIWGFWRDWSDHGDEVWDHVVIIGVANGTLVHDAKLRGEGSCPLWVGRFNPTPDAPHGNGPLFQGLPSLRQIDEMEGMFALHADLSLRPPITYPSDSFANIEQGLEAGMAVPIAPGSEGAVKTIYNVPPANTANYAYTEKLKKLRKLFFVDLPEQSGDTPPTLGQWLDEMARAQRRIGTPGLPFWRDLSQIFLRYKFLLEMSGAITPVKVDGRAIATLPRNPAQAAADQQELAEAARTAQILGAMFPEEFKMHIDGAATMKKWIDKARASGILQMRDSNEVANAVAQMSKLVAGRHEPGAPEGAVPTA
jgi:hypothetical protein